LLALNGLAELWGGSEVLGSRCKRRKEIAQQNEPERELENDANPVDLVGAADDER
jgi:hypothetical protein